jgi:hypothetical protein
VAFFSDTLALRELPDDDRRFRLLEPCLYQLDHGGVPEWIEAPAGFVTDFGSIPQVLWGVPGLAPFGRFRRAYVIHDKLYQAPVIRSAFSARAIDKSACDQILIDAMTVLGAGKVLRFVIRRGLQTETSQRIWDRYRAAR